MVSALCNALYPAVLNVGLDIQAQARIGNARRVEHYHYHYYYDHRHSSYYHNSPF